MGVDAAHVCGGLLATLSAWCEHHQIPYQGVPVGTIKKYATGKGHADKDEMIAACCLVKVATLVTRNTRDFEGLGLALFNPWP